MEASADDCKSEPAEISSSLESLLTDPDDNICNSNDTPLLQNEEIGKDLSVVDEITVTTEASLSDVISSSLQAIDGTLAEDVDPCDSVPEEDSCEMSEAADSCVAPECCDPIETAGDVYNSSYEEDGEKLDAESFLETTQSIGEPSGSDAMEGNAESESWAQSKRASSVDCENFQPELSLLSSFQPSIVTPSLTSSQMHTLKTLSPPANSNNSNSCEPAINSPALLPSTVISVIPDVPRKRAKVMKHGQIEVTLEGKNLWEEFYRRGTEMIVNRLGRRMFPGFAVAVNGLKPKAKYSMKVEMILADNHRFKFLNGRWLAVGNAEPQPLSETYVHPDSPNTGAFWMRHGVSFRKLKITNNKEKPGNNALIHSMHKYYLRLIIDEEFKSPPGQKIPAKNILQMDFPETSFIAVTAYQNEEVTQLKITNNPFAKAFRENAAEMDWEIMCHQNGMYSPGMHPDMYGNHHMMQSGMWPPQSPMIPPSPLASTLPSTPLSSSLPPYSPLTGLSPNQGYNATGQYQYSANMTPTAFSGTTGSVPSAGGYFQWPQAGGQSFRNLATGPVSSQALPPMMTPVSAHSNQLTHSEPYEQYHPSQQYTPSTMHNAHPHTHTSLPDFDSVFTASMGHS